MALFYNTNLKKYLSIEFMKSSKINHTRVKNYI